jgi:hypothetical protein
MNEQAILWIFGMLITCIVAVMGFLASHLWTHVVECHQVGQKVSSLDRDVERMKEDIGTHDTGMRGEIHRNNNTLTQHELRLTSLERK